MKTKKLNRRQFITGVSAASLGLIATNKVLAKTSNIIISSTATKKLAALGGDPVRTDKSWPRWPIPDDDIVNSITNTARSGIWCRIDNPQNGNVATFEKEYAQLMGTKYCVATGAGTQALHTCVEALGIGPGDEIITSPYTDMGTLQSILSARALPVLADIERDSFQIDPEDVECKITSNTRAIMPIHIMGQACNMDKIMAIAQKHNLLVIEDACQAHLGLFHGKRLGSIGNAGCFSHQSSKTIPCGEGGSIIGDDEALMDRCYTIQNHGTDRHGHSVTIGPKYRMNEFEAAILMAQMPKVTAQWEKRCESAAYLTEGLKDCKGLVPQTLYDGPKSGSFYLYALGYRKEYFNGVHRNVFMKALAAEGIPGFSSWIKNGLQHEPWVNHILGLKEYQKMYEPSRLKEYKDVIFCPNVDRAADDELVMLWASGVLLSDKKTLDDIINAIMKIFENRDQLTQM